MQAASPENLEQLKISIEQFLRKFASLHEPQTLEAVIRQE